MTLFIADYAEEVSLPGDALLLHADADCSYLLPMVTRPHQGARVATAEEVATHSGRCIVCCPAPRSGMAVLFMLFSLYIVAFTLGLREVIVAVT